MLLSISIFLTGRTGFLGILLGLLIIVIPTNFYEIPFFKMLKFFFKILIIVLPLFFLLKSFIPTTVLEIVEKRVLPWAFEMFQNDSQGSLETASSNELKGMYYMPPLKTALIGDGFYVSPYDNTRYYMDTDAGYMRHILFYGILGCSLMVTLYIVIFYHMFKFSNSLNSSPSVKIFVIFLCVYFFISHIKGDLLLGADMPIKALFTVYAIFTLFNKQSDSKTLIS